jgi:hypothetical protein
MVFLLGFDPAAPGSPSEYASALAAIILTIDKAFLLNQQ